MRAIVFDRFGDEDVLRTGEVEAPLLGPDDIRLAVTYAGVNRADLLQRQGFYPPPPGASDLLGLECSGEVMEVGVSVEGWRRGERAMALLAAGGYAEEVVVHADSAMHVPDALSDQEAGAIPETFLTAFISLFALARVKEGEWALLQGGGSGVSTSATTLLKLAGAKVVVTAGSAEKCARCLEHGADAAINYEIEDFGARAREITDGRGVDIILDHIGARYLPRHISSLATGGRLVNIGSMGGVPAAELDMGAVLSGRLQIIGTTLRARPREEKAEIVRQFLARFGDDLRAGRIRPAIHQVFPFDQAAEAHRLMKSNEHFGKLVLKVR